MSLSKSMSMKVIQFNLFEVKIEMLEEYRIGKRREGSNTSLYRVKIIDFSTEPIPAVAKITYANDDERIKKLIQSAEIHRSLHDHPAILRVIGIQYDYEQEHVCLLLEEALGSLGDAFGVLGNRDEERRKEILAILSRKDIALQIAEGVAYIHSKTDKQNNQISHRDIKPDNILFIKQERNGMIQIKITDFDSVKQLDVGEDVDKVTGGVFTNLYLDPILEEMIKKNEKVNIKNYSEHDRFGCGCTFFEIFGDGTHLFQGKNNDETRSNMRNFDRTNLMKSDLTPFEKNLIYALTHKDPSKRITMEEVKNSPYFQDAPTHSQALNEVSEAINHLKSSDPRSKAKIDTLFYLVLDRPWLSFSYINQDLLKGSNYTPSLSCFLRYNRNMLMHAQANKDTLECQFGDDDFTVADMLNKIEAEAAGTNLLVQYIAKRFFDHLPFTEDFVEPLAIAYEECMELKKDEIDDMAELYANVCPKAVEKVKKPEKAEEKTEPILETIHGNMVSSIKKGDPTYKALRDSIEFLQKRKTGWEKKVLNIKKKLKPEAEVKEAEAELADVLQQLKEKESEEQALLTQHVKEYFQWIAPSGSAVAVAVKDPIPTSIPIPVKGIIADQGVRSLLPTFKAEWASARKWPVGDGFVAVEHQRRIFFWGGGQNNPSGSETLPRDVIHIYDFEADSWETKKAAGEIHPGSANSAFVLLNGIVYIFGGQDEREKKTNVLSSLSLVDGVFKSLSISGDRPSPRSLLKGWSYEGKLYFFGGAVDSAQKAGEGILVGRALLFYSFDPYRRTDNLLAQYDPATDSWSVPKTVGQGPEPGRSYAAATLDHRVFIHGGTGEKSVEMFELNMKNMGWTLVSESGPDLFCHSLTPISPSRLLLIGGFRQSGAEQNPVWIFDAKDSSWEEQRDPLPAEFRGKGKGQLFGHRAIEMKTEEGSKVICLGGVFYDSSITLPLGMLVFSIK